MSHDSSVPSVFMKRKLDHASTASIDVVNLNNVIVKMRPKVHAAKLVVIQKLRDRIGKLRKRKGSDKQVEQNEKKAVEREKEIEVIKALGKDHISKYAIGSTAKIQSVCSKPGVSLEEIALVRLASHQYIQKVVQEFRVNHTDWKDLGAFLMTKQTNREFKKKKKKPDKLTLQMKQLKKKKAKVRIEASETLVKSYLNQKLKDEGIASDSEVIDDTGDNTEKLERKLEHNQDSDNNSSTNDVNSDASSEEENEDDEDKEGEHDFQNVSDGEESTDEKSDGEADSNGDQGSDGDDNCVDDFAYSDDEFGDIELGSNTDTDASDDANSDGYVSATEEESFGVDDFKSDHKKKSKKMLLKTKIQLKKEQKDSTSKDDENKDKAKNKAKPDLFKFEEDDRKISKNKTKDESDKGKFNKDSVDSKSDLLKQKKAKLKNFEKVQGEVIVKKLNLDEWCNVETNDDDVGNIVISLTDKPQSSVESEKTEDSQRVKKKVLDPFFDTGERLFQSRDSEKAELGKNLLAFAGYISETTENNQTGVIDNESNSIYNNDDYIDQHFNDFDEVFNEKSRRDGSVYRKANEIGKEAFRSTFMESLNGEEEFFKRKHFKKDKHHDRGYRDRHKEDGKTDYHKKKGLSAGTKAMFKKKGIIPTRDSKQEELGSSLLAIAGYQTDGTGRESKIELKQEFKDRKPDRKFDGFKKEPKNAARNIQKKNPALHPSWEASLKRKQQQTSKVEFTGKKIKFDED